MKASEKQMGKRLAISAITIGLLATSVAPAHAAVKAGAKCTTAKAKIVDHTSIITLNSLIHDYQHTHGKINLIGFENHRQLSHAPTSTRILKRN